MGSTLEQLIGTIESRLDFIAKSFSGRIDHAAFREEQKTYRDLLADLFDSEGARCRTTNGTYELTLAGIRTSCTAGEAAVIKAWLRKAKATLEARRAA